MGIEVERGACFCLAFCLLPLLLPGFEMPGPEEVNYVWNKTKGVVGHSVVLECGTILPDIYIWGHTLPGSESNRAIVYNYGRGPKVQPLAEELGELSVAPNTSSLTIEGLLQHAEGLYTCQALYDTDVGVMVTFYFTQLDVLDEGDFSDSSLLGQGD